MPAPEPMNRPAPIALPRPIVVSCRGFRAAPSARADVFVCCYMGIPLVVGGTELGVGVSQVSACVGFQEPEHAVVGGGVGHGDAHAVALLPAHQDVGAVERLHQRLPEGVIGPDPQEIALAWLQLPALCFQLRGHPGALRLDGCHACFHLVVGIQRRDGRLLGQRAHRKGRAVRRSPSAMAGAATA